MTIFMTNVCAMILTFFLVHFKPSFNQFLNNFNGLKHVKCLQKTNRSEEINGHRTGMNISDKPKIIPRNLQGIKFQDTRNFGNNQ